MIDLSKLVHCFTAKWLVHQLSAHIQIATNFPLPPKYLDKLREKQLCYVDIFIGMDPVDNAIKLFSAPNLENLDFPIFEGISPRKKEFLQGRKQCCCCCCCCFLTLTKDQSGRKSHSSETDKHHFLFVCNTE